MNKHEEKKCPRCGSLFECKAGTISQCQCTFVNMGAEQRAYIAERYHDCLCNTCLQYLSNELNLFKEKYIFR